MTNKTSKGFLLNTKLYMITNGAALLAPNKQKPEGKSDVQPEGKADVHPEETVVEKQEQTTTTKIAMRKIHANNLHVKLGHPGEDRICATTNHLHQIIKGTVEVCKEWAT